MRSLDVLVVSASRPHLLWTTLKSFRANARNVNLRFHIDEDVVYPRLSSLITKKTFGNDIVWVRRKQPPIGPFIKYLDFADNDATGEYMFILEDDWILPLPVDFDVLLRGMDAHPEVDELMLPYKTYMVGKPERLIDDVQMCLNKQPHASPAIWRTEALRRASKTTGKMVRREGNFRVLRIPALIPNFYETVKSLKGDALESYLRKNSRAFYVVSDFAMVTHIGCCWKRFRRRRFSDEASDNAIHELIKAPVYLISPPTAPITLLPLSGVLPLDFGPIEKELERVRMNDPRRCYAYIARLLRQFDAFVDEPGRKEFRERLEKQLAKEDIPERFQVTFFDPEIPKHMIPPA